MKARLKAKMKKDLKPIKNDQQSEIVKDGPTIADKKPKENVLLKYKLDFTFKNFGQNFNST